MPRGYSVDIDALHAFLFKQADRRGRLKLRQSKLAGELGITKFTMSRVVSKMIDDGRMRQITTSEYARGYFHIEDPEVWKAVNRQQDLGED